MSTEAFEEAQGDVEEIKARAADLMDALRNADSCETAADFAVNVEAALAEAQFIVRELKILQKLVVADPS